MRSTSGFVALGALAALLVLNAPALAAAPAPDVSAAGAASAPAGPPPVRPLSDEEQVALGCLVSAVGMTGAIYAIGPTEFVMVVVGGSLAPSSARHLIIGLITTGVSMACGAGAAFTPAVVRGWRYFTGTDKQPEPAAPDAASQHSGKLDPATPAWSAGSAPGSAVARKVSQADQ